MRREWDARRKREMLDRRQEEAEAGVAVEQVLRATLEERAARAVRRRLLDGWSVEAAAREAGLSPGTVGRWVGRARPLLGAWLVSEGWARAGERGA